MGGFYVNYNLPKDSELGSEFECRWFGCVVCWFWLHQFFSFFYFSFIGYDLNWNKTIWIFGNLQCHIPSVWPFSLTYNVHGVNCWCQNLYNQLNWNLGSTIDLQERKTTSTALKTNGGTGLKDLLTLKSIQTA